MHSFIPDQRCGDRGVESVPARAQEKMTCKFKRGKKRQRHVLDRDSRDTHFQAILKNGGAV